MLPLTSVVLLSCHVSCRLQPSFFMRENDKCYLPGSNLLITILRVELPFGLGKVAWLHQKKQNKQKREIILAF